MVCLAFSETSTVLKTDRQTWPQSEQTRKQKQKCQYWSRLRWKCLETGLSCCLTDEMQRRFGLGGFLFVKSVLPCRSFALFHFVFLRHFLRWTHAAHCRMAETITIVMMLRQFGCRLFGCCDGHYEILNFAASRNETCHGVIPCLMS